MNVNLNYLNAVPVALKQTQQLHLVLVGCGGNGSHMAGYLASAAMALMGQGKEVSITFIDPDSIEARNIPRQRFSESEVGINKAESLALRYGAFQGIKIAAYPQEFNHSMVCERWNVVTIVVGCVDKGSARAEIAKVLNNNTPSQVPNTWWIDLGNDHQSGQVVLGCSPSLEHLNIAFSLDNKCLALPSPALVHPDLVEDEQDTPPIGCAELALRNQQLDSVNRVCAGWAATYLDQLLKGTLKTWATYFDVASKNATSRYITLQEIEQALKMSSTATSQQFHR